MRRPLTVIVQVAAPAAVAPLVVSKGGRPRRERTIVVNVRLPISVYDAYCRSAFRAEESVRTVLRHVLTQYMPAA